MVGKHLFNNIEVKSELFDSQPVCGRLCWNADEQAYQFAELQHCPEDQNQIQDYNYTTPRSPHDSFPIPPRLVCDGKCDYWETCWNCVDELDCNGLSYGVVLPTLGIYPQSLIFLGGTSHLPQLANVTFESVCPSYDTNLYEYPLSNLSRCFYLRRNDNGISGAIVYPYCLNGYDQTNCSYSGFVAGQCQVDNFTTTISTHMLCEKDMPIMCDDKLDGKCFTSDRHCRVHKHRLCDGHSDCNSGADETLGACSRLTERSCKRRMTQVTALLPIPYNWVQDGVVDCVGGEDEDLSWERCGTGPTNRVRRFGQCRDVFLCRPEEPLKYLELEDVCATTATCGRKVCEILKPTVTQSTFTETVEGGNRIIRSGWCHKGLESLRQLVGDTCTTQSFTHPFYEFFGKTLTTQLVFSKVHQDCRYFYGEQYVYRSCSGQCGRCPLDKPILHSSCGNIENIRYSIAQQGVTVVEKDRHGYHNNFFACNTNLCIPFSKVCDLVDDCGDGSDEGNCESSMKCQENSIYIAVSQMCDGNVDCPDFSDECNSVCHRKSIEKTGIMVCAMVMGIVGALLSGLQIIKSVYWGEPAKRDSVFVNKVISTLIALGDLLTSLYLLILVTLHWAQGDTFCVNQLAWVSSWPCELIGVISTTGTTITSLSMAVVSLFKLQGTTRGLQYRRSKDISKRFKKKVFVMVVAIICIAVSCAVTPIMSSFEDGFVNGLTYEGATQLFLGVMTKEKLLKIIQGYHGTRMITRSETGLSWTRIRSIVSSMFTTDNGGVQYRKLSFYGNDPVCLFKFFVLPDDPQVSYVWLYISLHFVCFLTVAVCHTVIGVLVTQNTPAARGSNLASRLNRKIMLVCVTDFCCWMPFLISCALHTAEVVDMSPWYQVFSLTILPINAFINPLLYNIEIFSGALDFCKTMVNFNNDAGPVIPAN
eukprot:sb/3461792/